MTRSSTALALALLAALTSSVRADEPEAPGNAARAAELSALNPLSSLDKSTLDGFRDAPLFTPSRTRPAPPPPEPEVVAEAPPPAPEPVEEAPPDPPTLKLSGIAQGPDGAVAFVAKEGETDVEQLRLGDQIDGWLVSSIDPASLKLTLDEREQEYRMFLPPHSGSASADDEEDPDMSSGGASDSSESSDDEDGDQPPKKAQRSGAQHEMEAARKAQRDAQKRQQPRADPQQQILEQQQR